MKKWFQIAALLFISIGTKAQDTLWLKVNGNKLSTEHYITNSENIFTLGRIYNLPLAEIANENNALYAKGFKNGDAIVIPITKQNFITDSLFVPRKPIYYRVKNNETLLIIGRNIGVRQSLLQTWNNLPTPQLKNDQIILAGWIYYKDEENKLLKDDALSERPKNAEPNITVNEYQSKLGENFNNNFVEPLEQSGAIVFFDPNVNLEAGNYYALHASLPKGQIVKVTNPESNTSIYVTIIATLPKVEAYQNAILAISENAAAALNATNKRIFAKIYYK